MVLVEPSRRPSIRVFLTRAAGVEDEVDITNPQGRPGLRDRGHRRASHYKHLQAVQIVLDERALTEAGIDVTWHTTGSRDRVLRIHAPFPMEPPIVTATIPIEHRDNRWIVPELSNPTGRNHASAAR